MQIPNGKRTVTPYVVAHGVDRWLDFVTAAFDAVVNIRVPNQDGSVGHAEVLIGDSVLMAFDASDGWPDTPSFLSVYLDDVDAVVARALEAGAEIVTEVMTSGITGDRGGRLRDPVGNIWWVQSHLVDVSDEKMMAGFSDPAELATIVTAQASFAEEMRSRRS